MKIFLSTGAPGNDDWLVSLWKMTYILMIRLRTGELLGGVFPMKHDSWVLILSNSMVPKHQPVLNEQ